MASMVDRMIRAAKLDAQLYEEVEADKGTLGQAMGVVVLASIAAGVGSGAPGGGGGIQGGGRGHQHAGSSSGPDGWCEGAISRHAGGLDVVRQ